MVLASCRVIAFFASVASLAAFGYQRSPVNRDWPPRVERGSADSPPLSASDALKTFQMPPGYHVELVAAEPLVQDPVHLTDEPRRGSGCLGGRMRDRSCEMEY